MQPFSSLKNEDYLKNEDDLKNEMKKNFIKKNVPGVSLHNLICACFVMDHNGQMNVSFQTCVGLAYYVKYRRNRYLLFVTPPMRIRVRNSLLVIYCFLNRDIQVIIDG